MLSPFGIPLEVALIAAGAGGILLGFGWGTNIANIELTYDYALRALTALLMIALALALPVGLLPNRKSAPWSVPLVAVAAAAIFVFAVMHAGNAFDWTR
ncbi:hypothetical protein [Actinokineospora inagensis]|uniref:hypothetical protein n=1 Tax=Actinokineospora inagensis TaxID=103730 RepID=UPI00042719D1|nr:hypothetical protein [Actinokineospora inagensis]